MSDPLEHEKQFFDKMDNDLSQFYDDKEEPTDDLYSIQNSLKSLTNRFRSETFFASGAIKKVYTALEESTERKIALARPHDSDNPKIVESFLREARRTSLLQHANIVRVYDIGMDEQGPWFTMEFIEGDSLEQKIAKSKVDNHDWSLYEKLEIFNKVCDAMAYAHSIGIIHLDIKPDNIRIGEFGEILLCDWGLSFLDHENDCKAELSNDHAIHGTVKGTPGYMAPEQLLGQKSVQSDVFSLGALLFTLLTGSPPFTGSTTEEVLENTKEGKVTLAKSHNIPQRLIPVIMKALSPDLSLRYQSVSKLQEEIDKYRTGFATAAEDASLLTQIKLLYTRNRTLSLVALVSVALIVGLTYRHIQEIESKKSELISEKKKTEEAFELYKNEEEARNKILNQFSHSLISQSRFDLDSFNVKRALKNLKIALAKDPTHEETLMQLGFVYFIHHNFKLASDYFNRTNFGKVDDLKKISKEYYENKGLLSGKDLVEIFKQLKRDNLILYMFAYYTHNQKKHQEIVTVTKYLVERRNGRQALKFDYRPEKKSLNLSNNPQLKTLFTRSGSSIKDFCLLRHLRLLHLNLSNTQFQNLSELQDLNLLSLNLKNTQIKSLKALKAIPSLRQLTLSNSQKRLLKSKFHFKIVWED